MENASKALIIAGAILLAILIISLGILIYNQAAGVVNSNAMSEVERSNFNQKFTQYEGPAVRGTTVRALLQAVLSNNMSADSDDRKITVSIDGKTEDATMSTSATSAPTDKINTGSSYDVECVYGTTGGNQGLVTQIKVTEM